MFGNLELKMDIDKIIKAIPKITEIWFRTLEYLIVVGVLATVAYKLNNDWQAWLLTTISVVLLFANLYLTNMDRATHFWREENKEQEFSLKLWLKGFLWLSVIFTIIYALGSVVWDLSIKIISNHLM